MPNKNKNKGKSFEREIVDFLKELTGLYYQRVPNSGAFTGGKNQYRAREMEQDHLNNMDGDIIVPQSWSHISIECKFYKDFAWHHILQGDHKLLNKWIEQARQTTKNHWFLCFKINRQGWYVVFDRVLENRFTLEPNRLYYQDQYIILEGESFFKRNYNNRFFTNYVDPSEDIKSSSWSVSS